MPSTARASSACRRPAAAVNGFKVVSWSVEKLVDELDELQGSLTMLFARPEISRADLARATVKSEKSGRQNGSDTPGKGRTAGTYEYTVKSLPLGISFKDLGGTTGASVGVVTRGFTPVYRNLVASVNGQVSQAGQPRGWQHIDTSNRRSKSFCGSRHLYDRARGLH